MFDSPLHLIESLLEKAEKLPGARLFGATTRAATTAATEASSRLRTLDDVIPIRVGKKKEHDSVDQLSPLELSWIYAQLSDAEKNSISEHVRLHDFDALVTVEGFTPRAANLTHRVIGRLVFQAEGVDGKPIPMHHMFVELWDRDFGSDDILSRGSTDQDGRFELWYDPADAGKWDEPDLELRIYEVDHFYKRDTKLLTQQLIFRIEGEENVINETYDFGECRVPYWEYDSNRTTPRLQIMGNSTAPQSFSPSRSLSMAAELAPIELIRLKHKATNPSLQQVQSDYPENLTIELERETPGLTRSDEYFGERILNGMTASLLDHDPMNPDRYWTHHHWNSYQQDGEHAAPNVDIYFELNDGNLIPVEIKLQFRRQGDRSDNPQMQEKKSYNRQSPEWMQVKRIARVSSSLHAELDVHLAQTHLNLEQYAISLVRNLRKSPIRLMLMPHLKEVVAINHEADRWLLGEHGFITRSQALTSDAIDKRLRQVLGTLDWKGWRPRKPICRQHKFARAAGLYWQALTEYVNKFFDEHDGSIRKHWLEIHRFSQNLVDHSVPLFLCGHLRRNLGIENGTLPDWYETSERMDLLTRQLDNPQEKAIQPITTTDEPQPDDIENLKQVCRYVIYHATFFHYWMNSKQLDDGGEICYSGLGLRYGKRSLLAGEEDESIAPPPDRASEQLWFANALTKTNFGFILTNEDRDIPAGLRDALRAREVSFKELGVDVRKIPSRVNI